MRSYLQRFCSASPSEIKGRGLQFANRLAERLHISSRSRLISDRELLRRLNFDHCSSQIELLRHFRCREKPSFYSSFSRREETIAALRRFQEAEKSVIDSANRISEGIFSLLGFDDMRFDG